MYAIYEQILLIILYYFFLVLGSRLKFLFHRHLVGASVSLSLLLLLLLLLSSSFKQQQQQKNFTFLTLLDVVLQSFHIYLLNLFYLIFQLHLSVVPHYEKIY